MGKLQHLGAGAQCCGSATPWLRVRNHHLHGVHQPRSHVASQQHLDLHGSALQRHVATRNMHVAHPQHQLIQKRKQICSRSRFALEFLPI